MMKIMPEHAWVTREWVNSEESQRELAERIGHGSTYVCSAIREFIQRMGRETDYTNGYDRRALAQELVEAYTKQGGEFNQPPKGTMFNPYSIEESAARYEHAWLLRAEGKFFKQIGMRLGVSHERARQMVLIFGRRMQRAQRRARFKVQP